MTLRYKLRTLLILLAVLPPLVWLGWTKYEAWKAEQAELARQKARWEWLDRFGVPLPVQWSAEPPE